MAAEFADCFKDAIQVFYPELTLFGMIINPLL